MTDCAISSELGTNTSAPSAVRTSVARAPMWRTSPPIPAICTTSPRWIGRSKSRMSPEAKLFTRFCSPSPAPTPKALARIVSLVRSTPSAASARVKPPKITAYWITADSARGMPRAMRTRGNTSSASTRRSAAAATKASQIVSANTTTSPSEIRIAPQPHCAASAARAAVTVADRRVSASRVAAIHASTPAHRSTRTVRRSITARCCCTEARSAKTRLRSSTPAEAPGHLHRGQDGQAVVAAAERPDPDQPPELDVAGPAQHEGARERGEEQPPDEPAGRRRHHVGVGGRGAGPRAAAVSTRSITRLATSISARNSMCSKSGAVESTERIPSTRKSTPKT